ncbi:unnamed protein product [Chironomus riparius]|uniref:tRNA modification GTPase GTPBP3, mitochondrial n=1 Tax=Chironomus riparius TaxID=315576 RepID=A0A9N9S3J2_9DIPT|nr:unnamed protein product [Chironomus riparius]
MMLRRLITNRFYSNYTIFNKSSGNGKCGVAVIRVSGDKTKDVLRRITGTDEFKPRHATLKGLKDSQGQLIDNGLVMYFPGPKSFTGEDCCEFQVHGGTSVVSALLSALNDIHKVRYSEPGEFSKRAFLNGKMDLIEAEAVADLIHAETEMQRKQALIQAEGHLSRLYQGWRTKLIRNIAHIEAFIDFSEDENIESDILHVVQKELYELKNEIQQHLVDGRKGERLRDGVRMAIVGDTNVGKSSLMNHLVQKDVSIVTEIAGTTRDVIQSNFEINGYPIVLMDTAGLRKSRDIVETEGIRRAKQCAILSDLIILVMDGKKLEEYFGNNPIDLDQYRKVYLHTLGLHDEILHGRRLMTIVNKVDLMTKHKSQELEDLKTLAISCTKVFRINDVVGEITDHLKELCGNPTTENPHLSQQRHRFCIQECSEYVNNFLETYNPVTEQDLAILVQDLRSAVRCIGKITGQVRTDDILDVIFRDFCIGK